MTTMWNVYLKDRNELNVGAGNGLLPRWLCGRRRYHEVELKFEELYNPEGINIEQKWSSAA